MPAQPRTPKYRTIGRRFGNIATSPRRTEPKYPAIVRKMKTSAIARLATWPLASRSAAPYMSGIAPVVATLASLPKSSAPRASIRARAPPRAVEFCTEERTRMTAREPSARTKRSVASGGTSRRSC